MASLQLSLRMVTEIASAFVPKDWRVRVQYLISADGVVIRVENNDRSQHADLEMLSAGELYASAAHFSAHIQPKIEAAVKAILQRQEHADANPSAA